ncbi:uncharacterized protein Z519_10604 [Cladophialophora bantiana CBS 173.52]|uniref:Zn(2)-C6 fungal-type domain-containing protein n=1 Tax=Cladophialophora bantiana (strain ATCC 10958 / CBS 173.52 / CDC B-1940 / NIH 8579) TaxID=1442370 RepID=A0A0D2H5K0_CLAB1|nr:uncharacterized protein Z519_10604 [Cladophialophora bantiana CBS 173.52]KIW88558.1 hypothetical protein Z519_10604 [Cladophialophora bantiana CBS 173.52]
MAQTPSTGKGSRGGHSRSFGGCENCRRRHLKCDETRPFCLVCQRDGRECAGYVRNIFFWPDDRAAADRIRRHLFTDTEQRAMSESLLAHTSQEDAVRFLQEIDAEGENVSEILSVPFEAARGPFGVLRFIKPVEQQHLLSVPVPVPVPCPADCTVSGEKDVPDSFAWDCDFLGDIAPPDLASQYGLPPLASADSDFPDLSNSMGEIWTGIDPENTAQDDEMGRAPTQLPLLTSLSPAVSTNRLPEDAAFLLNHYVNSVIGFMTPVRGTKSPWHIIFYTHAKETVATLALGQTPDSASLSIFYAILSVSAYRSRIASVSQIWHVQANKYKVKALESLKQAIREASTVPKKFKYKSLLVALLTMIQVAILSGAPDQAEYYLFDAEKLIRLRGLTKPQKSRRVRLLHHCYSYQRILYESTFVLASESSQRNSVLRAVERSGSCIADQDSPTFKLGRWSRLEETMREIKSKESGENDLHLERPGIWSASLYPDIFGLPESFLVLLSQAIRLGNERDTGNAELSWSEFWSRASSLERCILQWQETYQTELDRNTGTLDRHVDDSRSALGHLLGALNHALSIYFYRRVYDLDASILQGKISLVRDHLLQYDQHNAGFARYHSGFIWPAFIAACEATDPVLQASFSMWFKQGVEETGLPSMTTMLGVAEQVWAAKRTGAHKHSWREVLRKNNICLFYS